MAQVHTFDPQEKLLRQAARGDRAAAAELVRAVSPRMFRLAWRMLGGDAAGAEDVVQDALIQLWRQLPRWQFGKARIETWLHTVVTHRSIDRLRRSGRHVPDDDLPETADPAPHPDARLIAADRTRLVDAAIAGLPDRQRAAIILVHFEDRSGAEAAETLGVSVEALESLLSRARRTLKARLAPQFAGADLPTEPPPPLHARSAV